MEFRKWTSMMEFLGRLTIEDMDMEIEAIELRVTEMMDTELDLQGDGEEVSELKDEDGDQVMDDKEAVWMEEEPEQKVITVISDDLDVNIDRGHTPHFGLWTRQ